VEIEIGLHEGSRVPLARLFAEADDSASQIAGYFELGEVLVARLGGTPVGHAQIVETDRPGVFELKSLAVEEALRSRGIGAALVRAALERCREKRAQSLLVATAAASISALKFYQRLGFRFSHVIRDFYVAERGYRPIELDGIPLLDEVILEIAP
jgi:ribosomal protein S18 acetylase RimI-like enzyme